MRFLLLGLCLAGTLAPCPAAAQTAADTEGVRRAALDYIEGFYEGDASKLRRSVRPEAAKFGFHKSPQAPTYSSEPMSFTEMIAYADRVKATGRGGPPPNAPKDVRVLDVQDQTAAAKVTAWWGTDYLQLARYDGKWMILHVLWQSPPPKG
jgi:hypothetical protein